MAEEGWTSSNVWLRLAWRLPNSAMNPSETSCTRPPSSNASARCGSSPQPRSAPSALRCRWRVARCPLEPAIADRTCPSATHRRADGRKRLACSHLARPLVETATRLAVAIPRSSPRIAVSPFVALALSCTFGGSHKRRPGSRDPASDRCTLRHRDRWPMWRLCSANAAGVR